MDERVISNIKALGIDMIDKANSGHPGIVLGASPIIYTLYSRHLNVNPDDPNWLNRDRFVLSAGHGSAMLYANLYMAGFNISLDDLKKFRRIGYKTPGHPEYGVTPGVEVSTGPLGQGIANAVGMALGGKILNSKYTYNGKSLFDFNVYVLCGDGDLMEGVSYEAISFAGNLKLNNLIVLYDSNKISLDGKTEFSFTENVCKRFEAMGWKTILVEDGENIEAIDEAIKKAKKSKKPTLIEIRTIIGRGSLNENSHDIHGKPLSKDDIIQLKKKLSFNEESFYVDEDARKYYIDSIKKRIIDKYCEWQFLLNEYVEIVLDGDYSKIEHLFNRSKKVKEIDIDFDENLNEATRETNGKIMNKIAESMDYFIGGSADLASSTKTYLKNHGDINSDDFSGKNIWFGVREHAMGAILNGLATLNFKVFGSTFLVFSDYLKPAIRLSSLMKLPVTYIFSHDSIDIGEDGPTHQPIEQLAMLRSIPNINVFRPADAKELLGCWNYILNSSKPSILVLGRNATPLLDSSSKDISKGAYIIRKEKEYLHGIIVTSGSEVSKSVSIANELYEKYKLDIRVVSMTSMNLFLEQPKLYQESIIPDGYRVVAIEPASSFGLDKFVYNEKYLICLDRFGESGSKEEVLKHMNFDYDSIKNRIIKLFM